MSQNLMLSNSIPLSPPPQQHVRDTASPVTVTCGEGDLCHGAHGGDAALSHHSPGGVEHVGPGQDETAAGHDPAAPAVLEPLCRRGTGGDVGTCRGCFRCR